MKVMFINFICLTYIMTIIYVAVHHIVTDNPKPPEMGPGISYEREIEVGSLIASIDTTRQQATAAVSLYTVGPAGLLKA